MEKMQVGILDRVDMEMPTTTTTTTTTTAMSSTQATIPIRATIATISAITPTITKLLR
jgi:hypothetical protein